MIGHMIGELSGEVSGFDSGRLKLERERVVHPIAKEVHEASSIHIDFDYLLFLFHLMVVVHQDLV